jgi:hypothetical protein
VITIKKIIAATIISASLFFTISLIISDSGANSKVIQPAWDVSELIDVPINDVTNVDGVNYTIKNN